MTFRFLILFTVTALQFLNAQHNGRNFSISAGIDYTTTAQIFLNPNSDDIVLRNKSFEIPHLYSPVLEIRYRFSEDIILGISAEYITKNVRARNFSALEGSQVVQLEVEDGVEFIPIEFSAYYFLPFSTEQFKFTMGAGAGYYFGRQTRIFGDTGIEKIEAENGLGIQVSVGMEYLFYEEMGLRLEMRFRDPEIKLKNRYLSRTIDYNGTQINLTDDQFESKINLDGISFLLGLAFQF